MLGTLLMVILIVFGIASIVISVVVARRLSKYSKAVDSQFANKLFCGKYMCNPDIQPYTPPSMPDLGTYNKNLALYCANLILTVEIASSGKSVPQPPTLTRVVDLYDNPSKPVIGVVWTSGSGSDKVAYVVFRGTQNNDEWLQDFNINQSIYSQVKLADTLPSVAMLSRIQSRSGVLRDTNVPDNILVHEGFMNAYSKVKNDLISALIKEKPATIVVTGHSLGAALSTLAAVDIASTQDILASSSNLVLYNFASPRVGNESFCSLVSGLKFPFFRLVNTEDIVPTVPSSVSPNFSNPESPMFFQHCGIAVYFTVGQKSLLNNHLLGAYINGIL